MRPRQWARVRRQVLARDGHRCQRCGEPGALEVHHKLPVEKGGGHELENLVTLCVKCHVSLHRNERIGPERAAWRAWLTDRGREASPSSS